VSQQLGALQTHTTDTFLFISHITNVPLFKFLCNIFIGVRIIKEIPGSVAIGTHSVNLEHYYCSDILATSIVTCGRADEFQRVMVSFVHSLTSHCFQCPLHLSYLNSWHNSDTYLVQRVNFFTCVSSKWHNYKRRANSCVNT
jgi:hypothetical protein